MIRLLVIDDSALMRRLLAGLFGAEPDVMVMTARSGEEALGRLAEFKPDVITLDLRMPGMDGLACLDRIMLERPTPVVVLSAVTTAGADETLAALALGAVDVVPKPSGTLSLHMHALGPHLVDVVRAAAAARIPRVRRLAERVRATHAQRLAPERPRTRHLPAPRPGAAAAGLVIVGASTGGPSALDALLGTLPARFPWPILVAQHMPAGFTAALARRLDGMAALDVVEVTGAAPLLPGTVYIGRGDADIVVSARPAGLTALAVPADGQYRWHPSVERLTRSAMGLIDPARLVGVMMTGMGNDGAAAMAELHALGGRTIAEAEETAVVWGMPGELVRAGGASFVLPLDAIGPRLLGMVAA